MNQMQTQAIRQVMPIWAPPPTLTVSEWANLYLHLSPEDSAEPGRYSTDRAPYQKGILDAFNEEVEEIVVKSSAQVGKTLVIKAVIGYYMHLDPAPMLSGQPTVEMSETFSKDRLAPMLRDTPVLRGLVRDPKSRDSGNTILHKTFPGGHLTMIGSNAPAGLASRPIRIVVGDEIDRWARSAGTEGDSTRLVRKRTVTFRDRKRLGWFSTPTIKGYSRIDEFWQASDQRRYYVPCPHCQHMHVLLWGNRSILNDDPDTMHMACPKCGGLISDADKPQMLARGEWRKENPKSRIAGFWLNELYSPWRKFREVAADYYAALGDPTAMQVWTNTSMGEVWDGGGEQVSSESLAKHRENYDGDCLPADVLCITAGVDTHPDRLELEGVGWGVGETSWGIEPIVFRGKTAEEAVWKELDEFLLKARYQTEDGRSLRILATCIDSGGSSTQQVYEFCTPRAARNIWAIKGIEGPRPVWPRKLSKSKKYVGHVVRMIGVDTAKSTVYARWEIEEGRPGYCHFSSAYDEEWFKQATSETLVTKVDERGRETRTWNKPKGVRNEGLDCRAYAYAALEGLKIERRLRLTRRKAAAEPVETPPPDDPPPSAPPPEPTKAPPPSGASSLQRRRRTAAASGRLRRRS
ncbi:phage terminase large subunit family protein [Chitinimonas lacunae]|uniref:Phage terminase large subunit family protein n=1 Tax=Chitinimonas lacunae TaxID=1963018 RepID=A0ABV8MMI5_9NEIS